MVTLRLDYVHETIKKVTLNTKVRYLIAGGVFAVLSIITLRTLLFGDSFFIYRDLTWPFNNTDLVSNALYSVDLELTRRLIYLGPFFGLIKLLGLSSLTAEKLLFFITKFFIGFFAYIAVYSFISSKIKNADKNKIFVVSLIAGFFYEYNPIATTMISTTLAFAFSYSIIPLVFYFFDKTLNKRGFHNIFITSMLICLVLAGTTQYLVLLPLFLLVPWLLITISLQRKRTEVFATLKAFFSIVSFTLLVSIYWIIAALTVFLAGITLQPKYVLSYDFLDRISKATTLVNDFRLLGDWWPRLDLAPLFPHSVWYLTFIIPAAIVFFVLYSRKSKLRFYLLSFAMMSLFIIFFYKGSQPPFSDFYAMLLNVPIVGWMFRIPSKLGMILAFFFMMILAMGFYNVITLRTRGVKRYLLYIFPGIFIVCIALTSWAMFTGDFGGIYKNVQYPGNTINSLNDDTNSIKVNIPRDNIAIVGGLDKLASLNTLQSFNPANSSLIFADQDIKNKLNVLPAIDKVILDTKGNSSLLLHMLPSDSVVVKPFDATKRYLPNNMWSRARTDDPPQGGFHPYLNRLLVTNKDIDYGKGLVLTSANNSRLEIPILVTNSDRYDLYVRYMENNLGGAMKIYFDNNQNAAYTINSLNQQSNEFHWKSLPAVNLTNGRHVLTLQNLHGLNAVNLFVLIPSRELPNMLKQMNTLLNKPIRTINILEAKDFIDTGKYDGDNSVFSPYSGTFNKTFVNEFEVPENASRLSLQFWLKQNPMLPSSYKIKSFELINLSNKTPFLTADFESLKNRLIFTSVDNNNLFLSTELNKPISGTKSFRVDIDRNDNKTWNIASSDFIPVKKTNGNMAFQLSVSGKDVNSLHSKVVYFDANKEPINEKFVFGGINGTFNKTFTKSASIPDQTKYIKLQFWVKTNPRILSNFLVDDIRIDQIYPSRLLRNNFEIFGNSYSEGNQDVKIDGNSVQVNVKRGNGSNWNVIKTMPINVDANILYKLAVNIEAHNVNSLNSKVVHSIQDVENSSKFGVQNAAMILSPHSEVSTSFDVLKTSNYTIATRVKTCEECLPLEFKIGDTYKILPLKNNKTEVKWLYFTTKLDAKNTDFRIYSNGETDLDKIIIYSDSYKNETLDHLFETKGVAHTSATLLDYKKISPIDYELKVNATRPFVLEFAEPYHPLWTANVNGKEYSPIQVYFEGAKQPENILATNYPAINGFVIDQSGKNLDIKIEYKPLTLFYVGAIISLATITVSLGYIVWKRRDKIYSLKSLMTKIAMSYSLLIHRGRESKL